MKAATAALFGLLALFAVPGIVGSAAAEPSWFMATASSMPKRVVAGDRFGFPELAGGVRWDDLPPERKDRAIKNYREYKKLSPEDRGRVDDGYRRWKGMSDDDKARIRDRYERKRKKRD